MNTETETFETPDPALVRAATIANGMAYVPPPPDSDDASGGQKLWDRTCWTLLALAAAAVAIDLLLNATLP